MFLKKKLKVEPVVYRVTIHDETNRCKLFFFFGSAEV